MRRLTILLVACFLSAIVIAQDNPQAPGPDQQHARFGRSFQGIRGTITAISKNQVTLKTAEGKTVTINVSGDTSFRKDSQPAKLEDFKVGDMVVAGGEPAGENAWNARFLAIRGGGGPQMRDALGKRVIAGEIKAIQGTSLTILRVDGETQTIAVDENTSFRKQGESITLADFKPGDHVFGRGELKNGIFVAAVLNWGELQMVLPQMAGPPTSQTPADKH